MSIDILNEVCTKSTSDIVFENASLSFLASEPELDEFCEEFVLNILNSISPTSVYTINEPSDDVFAHSCSVNSESAQDHTIFNGDESLHDNAIPSVKQVDTLGTDTVLINDSTRDNAIESSVD